MKQLICLLLLAAIYVLIGIQSHAWITEDPDFTVYIKYDNKTYHIKGCNRLANSNSKKYSVTGAEGMGFVRCATCDPPIYINPNRDDLSEDSRWLIDYYAYREDPADTTSPSDTLAQTATIPPRKQTTTAEEPESMVSVIVLVILGILANAFVILLAIQLIKYLRNKFRQKRDVPLEVEILTEPKTAFACPKCGTTCYTAGIWTDGREYFLCECGCKFAKKAQKATHDCPHCGTACPVAGILNDGREYFLCDNCGCKYTKKVQMATPNRNRFANRVLTMRYHTVVKFGLIIGVIMNLPYAMSGVSAILGIENSNNSEFSIGSPENFLFWFLFALIIAAITFQIKAFIEHLRWGRNFIKYLFTVYTLNLILPVLNIFTSVASEAYEQAVQAIVTLIVYLIWIIPIAVYYNKRKHMFDGVKKVL